MVAAKTELPLILPCRDRKGSGVGVPLPTPGSLGYWVSSRSCKELSLSQRLAMVLLEMGRTPQPVENPKMGPVHQDRGPRTGFRVHHLRGHPKLQ